MAVENSSNLPILLRAQAKKLGEKHYFTGLPCKSGHVAQRFTISGSCCVCTSESAKKFRLANPEKFRSSANKSRAKNRDSINANRRAKRLMDDPGLSKRLAERQHDRTKRGEAALAGIEMYDSLRQCIYGHVGKRFTSSYGCVECWKVGLKIEPEHVIHARLARRSEKQERSDRWRTTVENRKAAVASGQTQYIGAPCLNGHNGLRWVSSYECVECGRLDEAKNLKRAYDRVYAQKNGPKLAERSRLWVKKNPEKRKAVSNAYRDRRRQQCEGGDSTADIFAWERSAKKVCYWCGCDCSKAHHVDHYQPLSKGGKHEVSNLVIACPSCNLRKNAKDPYEFAASVGRLF